MSIAGNPLSPQSSAASKNSANNDSLAHSIASSSSSLATVIDSSPASDSAQIPRVQLQGTLSNDSSGSQTSSSSNKSNKSSSSSGTSKILGKVSKALGREKDKDKKKSDKKLTEKSTKVGDKAAAKLAAGKTSGVGRFLLVATAGANNSSLDSTCHSIDNISDDVICHSTDNMSCDVMCHSIDNMSCDAMSFSSADALSDDMFCHSIDNLSEDDDEDVRLGLRVLDEVITMAANNISSPPVRQQNPTIQPSLSGDSIPNETTWSPQAGGDRVSVSQVNGDDEISVASASLLHQHEDELQHSRVNENISATEQDSFLPFSRGKIGYCNEALVTGDEHDTVGLIVNECELSTSTRQDNCADVEEGCFNSGLDMTNDDDNVKAKRHATPRSSCKQPRFSTCITRTDSETEPDASQWSACIHYSDNDTIEVKMPLRETKSTPEDAFSSNEKAKIKQNYLSLDTISISHHHEHYYIPSDDTRDDEDAGLFVLLIDKLY